MSGAWWIPLKAIIHDEDYLFAELGNGNFDVQTRNADKYVGDFTSILTSIIKLRDNLNSTLMQINQSGGPGLSRF